MVDSTLETWVTNDGQHLAIQDWMLPPGVPVRGLVLVVHGLGEYAGQPTQRCPRCRAAPLAGPAFLDQQRQGGERRSFRAQHARPQGHRRKARRHRCTFFAAAQATFRAGKKQ